MAKLNKYCTKFNIPSNFLQKQLLDNAYLDKTGIELYYKSVN